MTIREAYAQVLIANKVDYADNFDKILATRKGSREHIDLLTEEDRLYKRGVRLREKLGILAKDPCSYTLKCYNSCLMTVKMAGSNEKRLKNCELFRRWKKV